MSPESRLSHWCTGCGQVNPTSRSLQLAIISMAYAIHSISISLCMAMGLAVHVDVYIMYVRSSESREGLVVDSLNNSSVFLLVPLTAWEDLDTDSSTYTII